MSRALNPPTFTSDPDGPWGVDTIGMHWCVVHKGTLRAKVVGPVGRSRTNYFDRALALAAERNRAVYLPGTAPAPAPVASKPAKTYVSGGSEYLYPKAGDPAPPGGAKVLLLTVGGICTIGTWSPAHVAWAPLPTRNKEKERTPCS
jgi:hypothetical protein